MKKTLFVTASFLLCLCSANAQNLSLGPTAGFGHAWLSASEDQVTSNNFHASYNKGGKLVYSFMTHWGISADLKFSSEGGSMSTDINEYTYRVNYIRLPLQGIYFFGELGDRVRPKVSLGPSFGFFAGGKSRVETNGIKTGEPAARDIFTSFDIGLTTAAGANFRLGKNIWLNTDLAYYHGFSDVFENSPTLKMRNRGIGINIGVTFPIGTVKPE
jgi:hypothetical protein